MSIEPFEIGVCSWSLQVTNVPELEAFCQELRLDLVQMACGDPHHVTWDEGDALPGVASEASFRISGAMIGFPGEDYTTPQTIKETGGFGNPATRAERLEILRWAVGRTVQLGAKDLMFHAGFIPEPTSADRRAFLDTLIEASKIGAEKGIHLALETGQEPADLLLKTLNELELENVHVNFDPANMLMYDMGDPIKAVETLGPYIRSVHLKDAKRPKIKGQWGEEVPLGQGQANIPLFVKKLKEVGFKGPLIIEREVGDQKARLRDIAHGVKYLREVLSGM